MKKLNKRFINAANCTLTDTFVNRKESSFIMKSNINAVCSAVQLLTYGVVLGGSLLATQANAQGNVSTPGQNPLQAQFEQGGKSASAGALAVPISGVAYRRIDGISLSTLNSNLPVTADEGYGAKAWVCR